MKKIPLTVLLVPLFFFYLAVENGELDFSVAGLFISTKSLFFIFGVIVLFIENMKSTIFDTKTNITDILLSALVFVIYLIVFLLMPVFKHELFFIYFLLTTLDLVGGIVTSFAVNRRGVDVHN